MKNWNRNKPKINLVIDAIMLLLLMAMAGLGFLIKFVLVAGYTRNELYGADAELYFLGLTRHEWGSIHLWLSLTFLVLLLLHIIFHWKMIVSISRQLIPGKTLRTGIATFIGVACLLLLIIPLNIEPEVSSLPRKYSSNIRPFRNIKPINQSIVSNLRDKKEETVPLSVPEHPRVEVTGYMTLNQVAFKYNIPVSELTRRMNVPIEKSYFRIGRLRRQYGFRMSDIETLIIELQNN